MTTATIQEKLIYLDRVLKRQIESCEESARAWAAKFLADPSYALSWGEAAFTNAAELKVAITVLVTKQKLEADPDRPYTEIWNQLRSWALEKVIEGAAGFDGKSSSAAHNEMSRAMTEAWAKFYRSRLLEA